MKTLNNYTRISGNFLLLIEKIKDFQPINYVFKKLYSFVSYNRKVIIPSERKQTKELNCEPEFNVTYRLLFVLFSVIIAAYTLFNFSKLITSLPVPNFKNELLLASGQIVFQGLFLLKKDAQTILNYIGNLMTVSLIGCIGLVQTIVLHLVIGLPQILLLFCFVSIVLLMFFEHKRRVQLLELPSYLSYTWIAYRLMALPFILNI